MQWYQALNNKPWQINLPLVCDNHFHTYSTVTLKVFYTNFYYLTISVSIAYIQNTQQHLYICDWVCRLPVPFHITNWVLLPIQRPWVHLCSLHKEQHLDIWAAWAKFSKRNEKDEPYLPKVLHREPAVRSLLVSITAKTSGRFKTPNQLLFVKGTLWIWLVHHLLNWLNSQ